ncbi:MULTISPECIES: tRNA uracil 4-sulfurtransferase ThiI [Oceanotoga]|uniref:Probable tRNA sulfurtransferase n=1 Tax=Oceanotoga teriensis TaxID=515440 RepID=A0AA45C986_9BACT|nr:MULTISPECIES: tRNA uracil 4-sulfurtransferase ThiI [Oceanotoga]MDO7977139.1 tRNA 4-thiouridine(8) synthase ThiI [Oceanotoga teriensis]PWJ96590.1 thiamine biosynthesis protein ThiI [Oceanotoga teriensis]
MYSIMVRINEIALKNRNKGIFMNILKNNIEKKVGKDFIFERNNNRIYLHPKNDGIIFENYLESLNEVFGIYSVSKVHRCNNNYDEILENVSKELNFILKNSDIKTFKIETKRIDKNFKIESIDMSKKIGEDILKSYSLDVDVHNPDVKVFVEIRCEGTYIYANNYKLNSGLPVGSSSKGSLLLSGGIDSPVAGTMMLKRGMSLNCINFMSPPYTGPKSTEKIIKLAQRLSLYNINPLDLYMIPLTKIQLLFKDKKYSKFSIILQRRSMMRIANKISDLSETKVIITGESLGQVASQTVENLNSIDKESKKLILRPLIGFDKEETIKLSKAFNYYDISTLPYEDSCTVFLPDRPATKSKFEVLKNIESEIYELNELEDEVINLSKKLRIINTKVIELEKIEKIKGGLL